jgi:uncharacterized SAM-binding protein YcdF (DUF218 family)
MSPAMNSLPSLPLARRSWSRRLVRRLLLLCAALVIAWSAGLAWFAEDMAADPAVPGEATDAIVVLTGGSARLRAGLDLLAQGRGRKLFVSGVYRRVDVAELLRVARARPEAVDCCIELGHDANDTRGNALETRDWMEREGFASLTLVTSTYHMRRALLEFRRALPQARLVPYAVLPDSWQRAAWWQRPEAVMLVAHEYNKYLLALARPFLPESLGEGAGPAVS